MATSEKVIALVLSGETPSVDDGDVQRLSRGEDGTMTLAAVETQAEFEYFARTTGCFRRGKAIRDPSTGEVIGHEMEEVSALASV